MKLLLSTLALVLLVFSPTTYGIAEGIMDLDVLGGLLAGVQEMFQDMNTTDVDAPAMLGKWHQMYKAAINFDVFRTNMFCHVSYFKPNLVMGPEGFSVEEAYHVISKSGPLEAYLKDVAKSGPGQFWVYPHQYFYPHQFYVIKAGPKVNDSYQYLIATDQNKLALTVLARNPGEFEQLYSRDVLDFLTEQKFGHPVFWNQPVGIYQGPDCYYPTMKEIFARRVLKEHLAAKERRNQARSRPNSPLQAVQSIVGGFGGKK